MSGAEKRPTVDIAILQRPTYAHFECPKCYAEVEIPYKKFCEEHGEPCDWSGDEIECPECGAKCEIDEWEFT